MIWKYRKSFHEDIDIVKKREKAMNEKYDIID